MKQNNKPLSIREVLTIRLPRIGKEFVKDADGKDTAERVKEFVEFKVCGVPIGFNSEYEKVWPRPRPPFSMIKRPGQKEEKEENYDDPAYRQELKLHEFHKTIYLVYRGLKADPSIEFECLSANNGEVKCKEDLLNIVREMAAAGLSEGDINILQNGIHAASHVDEKEVEAATKGF